jgi:arylsulfatase A-like enzyme
LAAWRGSILGAVLRGLTRLLGSLVLLVLVAALIGAAWIALRIARYEQTEDFDSMRSKVTALGALAEAAQAAPKSRPNFVVILFDDLGWGDLGAYRSQAPATPRLDRLAAQGAVFENYYAAAPYCTPSRAGLLTGRWPIRTGLTQIVFPRGHPIDLVQRATGRPVRLPADEITLAEALKAGGYATMMVGKWHLGEEAPSLPNDLGFERFLGVLHSNDMQPLPLWRDREIAEPDPVDQRTLTRRYTDEAVAFLEQSRERPFFLYVAHTFPHEPLHASAEHTGKSPQGLYGDVLADLDDSTGAIVDALERLGLARNTLVLVTSDNGPWFEGSAGGLRGRKNDVLEGGMRVPLLARWPGRLPAGQRIEDVAAAVDLLPTLLGLAGLPLPSDRIIDGLDLRPLLASRRGELPDRPIFYYADRALQAVRVGRWKAHRRHGVFGGLPVDWPFVPLMPKGPWLFDLARDPDESYDASGKQPEELERLEGAMRELESELATNPRGWKR